MRLSREDNASPGYRRARRRYESGVKRSILLDDVQDAWLWRRHLATGDSLAELVRRAVARAMAADPCTGDADLDEQVAEYLRRH